jgi:heme exporter protein D
MMEFVSQGGYAGYVWGAFGMTFGLLLIEVLQLRSSRKTTLTRLARLLRLRVYRPGTETASGSASQTVSHPAPHKAPHKASQPKERAASTQQKPSNAGT